MTMINGTANDDELSGFATDDTLTGLAGNDALDGGAGTDRAVYQGNAADYRLAMGPNGEWRVTATQGNEGSDTLTNIEVLQFADRDWRVGTQGEFRVNPTTPALPLSSSLMASRWGNFYGFGMMWISAGQVGSAPGVYGQFFNRAGNTILGELRIDTFTATGPDSLASTAMNDRLMIWVSASQDGSGYDIYMKPLYDPSGTSLGGTYRVNTITAGDQQFPDLGEQFVTWMSEGHDGSGQDIYGRFLSDYPKEFRINTTTAGDQQSPRATFVLGGLGVVVWMSEDQDGSGGGIYGQRFSSQRAALGGEFRINTTTVGNQRSPSVTALNDAVFVVAWVSEDQDGAGGGIYGQRFSSAGAALGGEFRVNTTTAGDQRSPSITALKDGSFVVAWVSEDQDGDGGGIYGQRFSSAGVALGGEFLINSTTGGDQVHPAVEAMSDGGFVVTWESHAPGESGVGIYYQRYDAAGMPFLSLQGTDQGDLFDLSTNTNGVIVTGGMGDDIYIVNSGTIIDEKFGQGTDTVQTSEFYWLDDTLVNMILTGSKSLNMIGNWADNTLIGNSGNNHITGNGGIDTMAGGAGDDIYFEPGLNDIIIEYAGEGTDLVVSSRSWTLGAELEQLRLASQDNLNRNINGTGNGLNNVLWGDNGDNVLDGGAGDDIMYSNSNAEFNWRGRPDNDTFIVDSAGDQCIVYNGQSGKGYQTVASSVSYALGSYIEKLVLTGSANLDGTGNASGNTLNGNIGNNRLDGGGGSDTLAGGLGNDTYIVDDLTDIVTEIAGEGEDAVETAISWTLGANLEKLTLTGAAAVNAAGNSQNNMLIGNSASNRLEGLEGDDWLDGGAGEDTLLGGAGNDSYVIDTVDDVVIEVANGGMDTLNTSMGWTLAVNLENLILTGGATVNGAGNNHNNELTGNSASNRLEGLAGNDWLDGGAGSDTLIGGLGHDTYVLDSKWDNVIEDDGEGIDRVLTSLSKTLGTHVEHLTLTGTGNINGTGNSLANNLYGNDGANTLSGGDGDDILRGYGGNDTLDGGLGADRMAGGLGDDLYLVDHADDRVTENANEGLDSVQSSVSFILGKGLENLSLLGAAAIDGTGNSADNRITGNSAANILTGKRGNDTLTGGLGNDSYVFARGEGADIIKDVDSTAGNLDVLSLQPGIAMDQLWFKRVDRQLEISVIGSTDKVTVQGWFYGASNQVEEIRTADGHVLVAANVQALVTAMASLTPPPAGQTTLSTAQHAALDAVIAANWS